MKNYINKFLITLIGMLFSVSLFGQQVTDLRINELLIKNDSNYVDEYGRHVPWLEIFNTAYNSVNVAECYLTDDTTGLASGTGIKNWYRIPKGDPKTLILQRSSVVFYLDNNPLYGTFHVNFDPSQSKTNYVALISSNGKTLIDIFEYPDTLRHISLSYGCKDDGIKTMETEDGKVISNIDFLHYFTPGSTNKVILEATKAEKLKERDPYGIGLAVIAMSVVFTALFLIFAMLKVFGKWNRYSEKRKAARKKEPVMVMTQEPKEPQIKESTTGEEIAAITLAVHLYLNSSHDEESEIITIEPPVIRYSPWSQKHLIMKRVHRKK